MSDLRLVHSSDDGQISDDGCEKEPAGNALLDSGLISSFYHEDKTYFLQNISRARSILVKLMNKGRVTQLKEDDLKYIDPERIGKINTLQDMYFAFRHRISDMLFWIRLDRAIRDKKPIIDDRIQESDWGSI